MLAITIVALCIYGIIDCARTQKESMPGRLPKPVWIVVALIPVVGALLWLPLSWPIKHPDGFGTIEVGRGRPRRHEPEGPIAPDDDPEFLAKLDARNRFAEWERQQAKAEGKSGDGGKPGDNDAGKDAAGKNPDGGTGHDDASGPQKAPKGKTSEKGDPFASQFDDLDAELRKFLDDEGSQSA